MFKNLLVFMSRFFVKKYLLKRYFNLEHSKVLSKSHKNFCMINLNIAFVFNNYGFRRGANREKRN